jgi:hypothetical protein
MLEQAGNDSCFATAVAGFGQILRGARYTGTWQIPDARRLAGCRRTRAAALLEGDHSHRLTVSSVKGSSPNAYRPAPPSERHSSFGYVAYSACSDVPPDLVQAPSGAQGGLCVWPSGLLGVWRIGCDCACSRQPEPVPLEEVARGAMPVGMARDSQSPMLRFITLIGDIAPIHRKPSRKEHHVSC